MLRIEIVSDRYAFYTRRATGVIVCGDKYGIRTFRLSIRSANDIKCEALQERYAPAHPIHILELHLQRLGSNPQAMVARMSGENARRSVFINKVSDVLEHLFHKDSVDGAYFQSGESEGNKEVVNALGCSEKLECMIQAKRPGSEADEWTEDTYNDNPGVDDAVDKNWARLLACKQDSAQQR
ncbi:hypothetical protein F5J12DRAFT_868044 [Pisolithus orientalis]|uniref:uncharacterized protein n=1 Tax=Pisolithus orientalis TaxID=936130 RepID=UPI002225853B|nr:uncharacterized protein F5J12DRAFT_868044 [Pisolithus orientalis]KAI5986985.1 hypothetical protein F5J12DRAFT_868044 [Pisolithus orientalis]